MSPSLALADALRKHWKSVDWSDGRGTLRVAGLVLSWTDSESGAVSVAVSLQTHLKARPETVAAFAVKLMSLLRKTTL